VLLFLLFYESIGFEHLLDELDQALLVVDFAVGIVINESLFDVCIEPGRYLRSVGIVTGRRCARQPGPLLQSPECSAGRGCPPA